MVDELEEGRGGERGCEGLEGGVRMEGGRGYGGILGGVE